MVENLAIIREYGQKPAIRAILSHVPGGVLVCLPANVQAIRSGDLPEPMMAFPKKDVFLYDAVAAVSIQRGERIDWTRLKPMKEAAN